jgi:hypothetical protein
LKITTAQRWVALLGLVLLAVVVLFPPWWQGAEREVDYRKEIGHAYLFRPPASIPVDCYFVGCVTAPASYFHVMLHRERYIAEIWPLVLVIVALLWLLRSRRDGNQPNIRDRRLRLQFSAVLALAVPLAGDLPIGAGLADIPRMFIHQEFGWLVIPVMMIMVWAVYACVIYLLVTGILKLRDRSSGATVLNRPA